MRTRSKHFYASVYFLNELLSNKKINAVKLSKECDTCLRNARTAIKEVKSMLKDLNLNLVFWYDNDSKSDIYYLASTFDYDILQKLTYKNLHKHLPYIVMIKLMFNQKVNYKELSQDGFKCSKKMLYPIIEELRIALNLLWLFYMITY